jgi:hypothetical protein
MLFSSSLLPEAFERAFAALPDMPVSEWAEKNVWLENKHTAEAGPYRPEKTPWNIRVQDFFRRPEMFVFDYQLGSWIKTQVTEVNVMKCSQGGVSEANLNGIRWTAQHRPRNVIYTIDTRETAKDISDRLVPSLRKLDGDIFTGDDDDVGTYTMRLRAMDIWFQGSFSTGKFASKQAPLVICDEVEEHGTETKDTSTTTNAASRKKCADDGLQVNLCKPKLHGGPIHRLWRRGNREQFHIQCPHCAKWQEFTFFRNEEESHPRYTPFSEDLDEIRDEQTGALIAALPRPLPIGEKRKIKTGRLVFGHCKNLLGEWDELRILRETYYECAHCLGKIEEHQKGALLAGARWIPTAIGTPGIVSQHINDLYSTDRNSTWGRIVLDYIAAKRGGRGELQGFYNHRLGLPFRDEAQKTTIEILRSNIAGTEKDDTCPPYKRGQIPWLTQTASEEKKTPDFALLILGADIGGNYAKWAVGAVAPNFEDVAIVDWGEELDPDALSELMLRSLWPLAKNPAKKFGPRFGFADAKYRKTEVYKACLAVPGRVLIPVAGLGGTAAQVQKLYGFHQLPSYPQGFKKLTYNDREAKDELYTNRFRLKKRRVYFPTDLENDRTFCDECSAEELVMDERGVTKWNENPAANHWGDCVKNIVTGLTFKTRSKQAGT